MNTINSQKLLQSTENIMQGKNRYQAVREVIDSANELAALYSKNKIGGLNSALVQKAILRVGNKP